MKPRGIAPTARQDRVMLGITLVLIAYLLFSLLDTSAKWVGLAGIPTLQVAFMRFAGHFVISSVVVVSRGQGRGSFATQRVWLTMLRGAFLLGATVFNFLAIRYIPLTLTSTILFMAPLIVCAMSWPLLGERVGALRLAAIVVGFLGVLIAVRPFDASFHWAVFLSLASATSFAFYQVVTRVLSGTVATDTMQFYSGLVGTVALAPFALTQWVSPDNILDWGLLLGLGILGYVGHELLTRAYGFAEAARLSPFSYSVMVYLSVCSYLVFDNAPDIWTLAGAAVVISAGLFIWFRERQITRKIG